MTREDVIRMAKEAKLNIGPAGMGQTVWGGDAELARFAVLVLANNPPHSSMAWQEGFEAGKSAQNKEMEALRELAAGRCTIQSVIDELGPMSLWSKASFDREIFKAVSAEREACAKVCESLSLEWEDQPDIAQAELATMMDCALAVRARSKA